MASSDWTVVSATAFEEDPHFMIAADFIELLMKVAGFPKEA